MHFGTDGMFLICCLIVRDTKLYDKYVPHRQFALAPLTDSYLLKYAVRVNPQKAVQKPEFKKQRNQFGGQIKQTDSKLIKIFLESSLFSHHYLFLPIHPCP